MNPRIRKIVEEMKTIHQKGHVNFLSNNPDIIPVNQNELSAELAVCIAEENEKNAKKAEKSAHRMEIATWVLATLTIVLVVLTAILIKNEGTPQKNGELKQQVHLQQP